MNSTLENILVWAEQKLPEGQRMWISDLRSEAGHIPGVFARRRFLWSGTLSALGEVLRVRVGVQRVGQTLLGMALIFLCLGGVYMAPSIENEVVRTSFYLVLPVYAVTAGLAFYSLNMMRGFAAFCIIALGLFWLIAGLEAFTAMDAPVYFFRAFAVEVAMVMAGLFIAASYLNWVEDADHA